MGGKVGMGMHGYVRGTCITRHGMARQGIHETTERGADTGHGARTWRFSRKRAVSAMQPGYMEEKVMPVLSW